MSTRINDGTVENHFHKIIRREIQYNLIILSEFQYLRVLLLKTDKEGLFQCFMFSRFSHTSFCISVHTLEKNKSILSYLHPIYGKFIFMKCRYEC